MTTAPLTVPATQPKLGGRSVVDILIRYAMVIILLIVMAFFAINNPRFATVDNMLTILTAAAPFAFIALGQTLVILTGGIDLSVGSVIAVGAMAAAWTAKFMEAPLWVVALVSILVGVICGSINGLVVSRLNVPPFVATLGMMTLASGFAYVIGGGAPINGLPKNFGAIANSRIAGITIPVFLMIIAIVALGLIMRRTAWGLRVYAVGGNETAAQIAGVKTKRVLFSVYAISGALAGLSGIMLASRTINGAPTTGSGYELDAIAAAVIGGASLSGGRGTVWGTAIGLFLIQILNNGLDIMIVPAYWQKVIKGALIVTAVAIDVWAANRRK
jgi:ribose transport system permease protein